MRYTKEQRQAIIDDFALRHGGRFDAPAYFDEVCATGESHPGYAWFEWNKDRGWREYNIDLARKFGSGCRLVVREEITEFHIGKVNVVEMPFVMSPLAARQHGGGYFITDPKNPEHMREYARQAAMELERWLRRHEAALLYAGGSPDAIRREIAILRDTADPAADAA